MRRGDTAKHILKILINFLQCRKYRWELSLEEGQGPQVMAESSKIFEEISSQFQKYLTRNFGKLGGKCTGNSDQTCDKFEKYLRKI